MTDEQLKQLGINVGVKKETPFTTPFTRYSKKQYWSINAMGVVTVQHECDDDFDNAVYNNVNYFSDYSFAQQVALHQLLYRKLLKYSYEKDAFVDDWTDFNSQKYFVSKSMIKNTFYVDWNYMVKHGCECYFTSKEVAEQAIEDVVKPFMTEHPEFIW